MKKGKLEELEKTMKPRYKKIPKKITKNYCTAETSSARNAEQKTGSVHKYGEDFLMNV